MPSALARKTDRVPFDPDGLMDRARGAYLGLAVGDALGATVEFMTPREIAHVYGQHRHIVGGGWLHLKPGQVTDDTEMSLALGRAILLDGGFRAQSMALAFDGWLKSKPVDVGHTVRRGIVRFRADGSTLACEDEYDAGNGAVMRVLPAALATLGATDDDVEWAAKMQAHVTHNAPLADVGMVAVVRMVQRALLNGAGAYQDMVQSAHALARLSAQYDFTKKRQINPSGFLPETLRAVFQAFVRTDGFEAALIDVVNRGGDADTTGAILGFMAGALYGAKAIPPQWCAALDPAVHDACEDQALRLLEMSPILSGKPVRFIPN